jgi:cell wall-associated NlpC family hydrolase
MNPKTQAVVDVAIGLIPLKIPYVLGGETLKSMDCQGLVEYCIRKAGGSSNFVGSNAMYHNGVTWRGTIAEAKAQGKLVPGAAVFVLKQDGGEPEQYKYDGLGNANHVGLYCGRPEAEIVSASSVKGYVGAVTLDKGWTHVGWMNNIDYTIDTAITLDVSDMDVPKAVAAAQAFIDAVYARG